MKSYLLLEKISKMSLYAAAFLFPLWFLPFTQDTLNFQKQALLVVCAFVALIAWLAKNMGKGELTFRMSWLHLPVLGVVLSVGISTIVSLWRYGSFWGWPLNVSDSFLTIALFAVVYFLISNSFQETKELFRLFLVFIASVALGGIFAIAQFYQFFAFPFDFAKVSSFNTIGSASLIAMLAAVLLPLALAMASVSKVALKWALWIFSGFLLALLVLLNIFNAWLVLTAGLLVLLAFGMWNLKKRAEFGWVSFPMALLIVALFFMVFKVSFPWAPQVPAEVSPSRNAEIQMLKQSLPHNVLFGTGPGTFIFNYAKYHDVVLNQTIFWSTRFTVGASEILDWFMTKGVVGGGLFVLTLCAAIFFGVQALIKAKEDAFSGMIGLGMLASFVALVVAQSMYASNLTLSFLFWILLGGLGVFATGRVKKISIAPPSFLAVISSFTFLLVLIFGIGLLFLGGQKYAAEIQYLKGARIVTAGGDSQKGTAKLMSAAQLNSSVDLYWRDLSQLYLNQFTQIASSTATLTDAQKQQAQDALANALAAAKQAVAIDAANVENWNVQGFIARNLIGVAQGADAFAVSSYQKATDLEPASPFSWTELGRVYLLQAQAFAAQKNMDSKKQDALNKALENLNKAIALKADYAPADYLIATVYDAQGKSDQAISKLEETQQLAPKDIGLAFQLGVVYYQKNDFAKAQSEFELARSIDQNYANARYMLGLAYDKQGKKDSAIAEFTKVLQLNPDNEQIKKIVANLQAGKPALTGVQQSQPPISQNPPEIKGTTKTTK